MNLVVIGAGRVGLSNALGFAKLGHRVACVDADLHRLATLDVGEIPFFEPGMRELLREMQEAGRVVFTSNLASVIEDAEAILLCSEGDDAAARLREQLPSSTRVAVLPEPFSFHPARIVIGIENDEMRAIAERLCQGIEAPILFMSFASAKMVREAADAFTLAKVSFVSDIAERCERAGADLRDVADALSGELVIGPDLVRPGARFVERIERVLGGLKGRSVAVWGLTDLESVRTLYARGAEITAYDPKLIGLAADILPGGIEFASTAVDACDGAEALVVLSATPEFRDLSFTSVRERMLSPNVFDERNLFADMNLEKFGFSYYGVGIPR